MLYLVNCLCSSRFPVRLAILKEMLSGERGINFVEGQYDFLIARPEFYSWVCKYCDSDLNIKHPKRTNIHKDLILFHILKL